MMERPINRRAILAGAAAIPVLTGKTLDAAQTDPVLIAIERWKEVRDHLDNYPGDIPDDDPVWDINTALETKISETRAQTLEGLSAQLEFAAYETVEFASKYGEGKRLYENMQATLRALAARST